MRKVEQFKLIAIRPITPENVDEDALMQVRAIQKKIFGRGWLYFYAGYELFDAPGAFNGENGLIPHFAYSLKVDEGVNRSAFLFSSESLQVNISVLIGENGSGKSSVVDLLIRLLNNFAVTTIGEIKVNQNSDHLHFIDNLYGALVFQSGGKFYSLVCYGRSVKVAELFAEGNDGNFLSKQPFELLTADEQTNASRPIQGENFKKLQLTNLFYSTVFNYSLYAYNYNDFFDERTLVNRWVKDPKPFDGPFEQAQVWLNGLFHKNDGYQTPIVIHPHRRNGIIDSVNENKLAVERILSRLFYPNKQQEGYGEQPMFPFRTINEHLEIVALRLDPIDNPKFSKANYCKTLGFKDNAWLLNEDERREGLRQAWCSIMCMWFKKLDELSYQEALAWDYVIYKTLKIAKSESKTYRKLRDTLLYNEFNYPTVTEQLRELITDESHITLKLRRALTFIKYRFIREKYVGLVSLYDIYRDYSEIISAYEEMNLRIDDNMHLVGKTPIGWIDNEMPQVEIDGNGNLTITYQNNDIHPIPRFSVMREGILSIAYPSIDEIVSPPIFDIHIQVIEKSQITPEGTFDFMSLIPFEGLSSGEKQLMYAASNLTYHLSNIESVWGGINKRIIRQKDNGGIPEEELKVKYRNVNVVFDEVELYFHPDLQRRFVKYLLDAIHGLGLNEIQGINILLVTHSPFILSDVPNTNILYLSEKEQLSGKTFAANIHDLLSNSFFMEYSIGELSRSQIDEFLNIFHMEDKEERKKAFEAKRESIKYLVENVADEYL